MAGTVPACEAFHATDATKARPESPRAAEAEQSLSGEYVAFRYPTDVTTRGSSLTHSERATVGEAPAYKCRRRLQPNHKALHDLSLTRFS